MLMLWSTSAKRKVNKAKESQKQTKKQSRKKQAGVDTVSFPVYNLVIDVGLFHTEPAIKFISYTYTDTSCQYSLNSRFHCLNNLFPAEKALGANSVIFQAF